MLKQSGSARNRPHCDKLFKAALQEPFALSSSKPVLSIVEGGERPLWFDKPVVSEVEGLTTNGRMRRGA